MFTLIILIPITFLLSLGGLIAFLWSIKNKQYDDLEGSASRILFDDKDNKKE
ncbi:MAG: cbb3-type cytochrome oxidase assembly protein CcoS [Rickettsiales bacterium]|nr:cbb3-type cytochrome oxidase assembly protein CcoS [Rickettsiales bacterium]